MNVIIWEKEISVNTYRVGFAKSTGRDPVYIEAESFLVIDEAKKVLLPRSRRNDIVGL